MVCVLERSLVEPRGLGGFRITAEAHVLESIASMAQGDLRRALNTLETMALSQPMGSVLSHDILKTFATERHIHYDKNEDQHYDTISAFIKSVRGNDPDAALYWMMKMLEAGEDPRFIARRLVILASEDVGLADSRGLPLAMAAYQASEVLGMPECAIPLSHATIFLATAPKSNSAYMAMKKAQEAIRKGPVQAVPLMLRDSSTYLSKQLGHGSQYRYSHDYPENISGQEYMLEPMQFYTPKSNGSEAMIAERLARWSVLKKDLGAQ